MRRPSCVSTVTVELTQDESDMLDLMRGGLSRADSVRTALWSLADHMGYDPPLGVFDCHGVEKTTKPARALKPKRQTRTRIKTPHIRQNNMPAPNHPWRGRGLE